MSDFAELPKLIKIARDQAMFGNYEISLKKFQNCLQLIDL